MVRVAIIGSGPAGFYLASRLLRKNLKLNVSMIEANIFPFGLVRYGVAPDHPEVKNCLGMFHDVASNERFKYYGNLRVDNNLPLTKLYDNFDIIASCTGVHIPRRLGIVDEENERIISSDKFIGWINGNPNAPELNLESVKRVGIIGTGNVALDVARLLLKNPDCLQSTDISSSSLKQLRSLNVDEVHIFGRRSGDCASFTVKEYREMLDLNVNIIHNRFDIEEALGNLSSDNPRRTHRLVSLMSSNYQEASDSKLARKSCSFHFNHRPISFQKENSSLSAVFNYRETEKTYKFDMIVTCLGYEKSDSVSPAAHSLPGGKVFSCGWASTGAVGSLASTKSHADSTADSILTECAKLMDEKGSSRFPLDSLLKNSKKSPIYWKDVLNLTLIETEEGSLRGKLAEKIKDHSVSKAIIEMIN